jgi:hypothetical protein
MATVSTGTASARVTLLGFILLLPLLAKALAAPNGWLTYVNPEFGTRIDYPAYLFPTEPIATGTGITLSANGVYLEISAIRWDGVATVDDLLQALNLAPGYEVVTYNPRGARWVVVSGYREDRVFYEKFFVTNGSVQAFSFEYPIASRQLYDPLVEILEDSFRPGP